MIKAVLALAFGATIHLLTSLAWGAEAAATQHMLIGWSQGDITPPRPAALGGMASLRVASEVMDPLTVTALAMEAPYQVDGSEPVILVSCDLRAIFYETTKEVRAQLKTLLPEIDPNRVILFATHTHNAPPLSRFGQKTDAMDEPEYVAFAAPRIAAVAAQAWNNRRPGGISFGLSHAVIGHNRIMAFKSGKSVMNGRMSDPDFSHVEGYVDSATQLLYTWNEQGELTGVVINVAVPSQVSQSLAVISADYWHDTRVELRRRLGDKLYVLPQCSAAGDQMSRAYIHRRGEDRMEKLSGRNRRQQIAMRLADAATSILPVMEKNVQWNPVLSHRGQSVPLRRRIISQQELDEAQAAAGPLKEKYEQAMRDLADRPQLKDDPKWMAATTRAQWDFKRVEIIARRFQQQKEKPLTPAEMHVIRLGDMAIATNPFELYLDYGLRIVPRSKAVQTFLVQLAVDCKGYLPTARSIAGGAYGADPASTDVGPEGGDDLVNWTIETLNSLWPSPSPTTGSPTPSPQAAVRN